MSILEDALELASRGWPVLWLRPRSKQPWTAHGVLQATTTPEVIRSWAESMPDANLGIACGAPGPDVLDVDDRDAAGDVPRRCVELGGPVVATARGVQHYFAGTEGRTVGLGWGELRRKGSYVVCPPSVHPTGKQYTWISSPNGVLPNLPVGLVIERSAGTGKAQASSEKVPHGARHEHLKDFAVRLARAGVTDPRTLLEHLSVEFEQRCDPDPPPEPGSLEKLASGRPTPRSPAASAPAKALDSRVVRRALTEVKRGRAGWTRAAS